jgi:hypothetical protein
MKTFATVSILVIVGLIVFLMMQQRAQEKLRAENESLVQQLAQLQTDNENFSNQLAQTKDSQSFSDDKMNELLKLRGEVGVLRNQLGQSEKARQNQTVRAQASTGQNQTLQLTPDEQFELHAWHTVTALKQLGLAMRIYASDNNNQYATNFDQLKNELSGRTNFQGNINLDTFEFINSGVVNDSMPQAIMFREIVPRTAPNGHLERAYGLADGSVQTVYGEKQGDETSFDDFEKQHSPPPTQ